LLNLCWDVLGGLELTTVDDKKTLAGLAFLSQHLTA